MLFGLYTPEEINTALRVLTELILLIFATSAGTFTRELLFPSDHSFKKKIGFCLVAGFIAFGITLKFTGIIIEVVFLICIGLGFFIPAFEKWFSGVRIFKVLFKVLNKTKSVTGAFIEEMSEELEENKNGE